MAEQRKKIPQPETLWRFNKNPHTCYEVARCDGYEVYYHIHNDPENEREFKKELAVFLEQFTELDADETLEETGGMW